MKKILLLTLTLCLIITQASYAVENTKDTTILKEQGTLFYQNHDYQNALNYLIQLPYQERDEKILLMIANCYQSTNNNAYALSTLRSMLKKYPKNSFAYYNLGIITLNQQLYKHAIVYFKKSIKYDKKFFPAHYNLGFAYYKSKEYKDAYKTFKKAHKLNKNNSDTLYNLALVCDKLKKERKAKKYLALYEKLK